MCKLADFEKAVSLSLRETVSQVEKAMEGGSAPARLIDQNEFSVKGIRVAVRVYEEAASAGLRRTQMTVTMASDGKGTQVSARTASSSRPFFFYLRQTAGEQALIDALQKAFP